MHYLCRCLYLLQVTLVAFGLTEAKADLPLTNGCSVHFATVAEAKAHLAKGDVYIKGLSPFERAAKITQAGPVSTEQYIEFIQGQALEWDADDTATLREVSAAATPTLNSPVACVTTGCGLRAWRKADLMSVVSASSPKCSATAVGLTVVREGVCFAVGKD